MKDQIEAGRTLIERFDAVFPVEVAFWLKDTNYREWSLYLASEAINEATSRRGYLEALRLADAMVDFDFEPYRLNVVAADNPTAREAISIQEQFPAGLPHRYRGPQLGGVGTEEVYIYPSRTAVPG